MFFDASIPLFALTIFCWTNIYLKFIMSLPPFFCLHIPSVFCVACLRMCQMSTIYNVLSFNKDDTIDVGYYLLLPSICWFFKKSISFVFCFCLYSMLCFFSYYLHVVESSCSTFNSTCGYLYVYQNVLLKFYLIVKRIFWLLYETRRLHFITSQHYLGSYNCISVRLFHNTCIFFGFDILISNNFGIYFQL